MEQYNFYEPGCPKTGSKALHGSGRLTLSLASEFAMSHASPATPPPFHTLESAQLLPGVVMHQLSHCQDDVREYAFAVEQSPLSLSFCSKGRAAISIRTHARPTHIMHSASTCTLSFLPEAKGSWMPLTHECNFCTLQLSQGIFKELWTSLEETLCPELVPLAHQKDPRPFFMGKHAGPAVQMAVHSLTNCPPVRGGARELFLRCKLMEILMLLATQPSPEGTRKARTIFLSKDDVARIHQARDILERQIENPPSLPQLARLAGLNEFKLKRGFRQIFATTPYNHLRVARLHKAKEYIEKGEMNVCEACMAVGYSNLGNFIDLFKKHYGTTPGGLRKSSVRANGILGGNA